MTKEIDLIGNGELQPEEIIPSISVEGADKIHKETLMGYEHILGGGTIVRSSAEEEDMGQVVPSGIYDGNSDE